ncbi:response regulator [Dactylosporangium sp. NPDC050588]|uniref:response regulator transcription factor n=1 Tax=Dactylosporangium sp. NPDC050588 TaxID=3157211 RepID=UPI0033DE2AAA
MPGLNGLDVCRALRADPATAGVPILMLSAYAMPADLQAGFDAGADDYMMKPFQGDELIAPLHRADQVIRPRTAAPPRSGPATP